MLGEARSLTSVPPKKSLLYRGGVWYFQMYASVKEVWDAAKSMPFANEGLEELTLNLHIRKGAQYIINRHARNAHIIKHMYLASKC